MLNQVAAWLTNLRKVRANAIAFEGEVCVSVSDDGLTSSFPNGETQFVAWESLVRILVQTNDSGPSGADVWWILEGLGANCTFPQGATGEDAALAEIRRRFPTFEVKGMNSVANAKFVCWEKGHAL